MKIIFTLLIALATNLLSAQITFQHTFGPAGGFDYSLCGIPVSTGGYIMAMNSDDNSTDGQDMVMLRTDLYGVETWRVYFGSPGWEIATDIIETSDGGFAMCGSWNGLGSDSAVVIKTDASGNLQWLTKIIPEPGRAVAHDLVQIQDGSILVTGFTTSNGFLAKLDATGNLAWQKIYGNDDGVLFAIQEMNGNGFILGGTTAANGTADFWLVRTDANGDTLWTKALGTTIDEEEGYDVCTTQDGGFAICGYQYQSGGDAVLIKTNSSGTQQWMETYDGGGWEQCHSLAETWDGGFALAGRKENPSNVNHMWLIRTDASGSFMWDRTYPMNSVSGGDNIENCPDGGFLIAGSASNPSDAYLVKTESAGWVSVPESTMPDGDFTVFADQTNALLLVRFNEALPGRRIRITDIQGKEVANDAGGEMLSTFSTVELASGMYVVSAVNPDGTIVSR
ncbi:MAG TPA: T9SS type A sorting domain-containing protein, partial [Bacteroidia bacterium]|nr:T9SS type A sorting domain-containing protein [Bacteroidia bacterium]